MLPDVAQRNKDQT